MIYDEISKHRRSGINRKLLSVIMSEITIDGKPMQDKEAIERLKQMKKQSLMCIDLYTKACNEKQADQERKYLECINNYLPKEATREQIIEVIKELNIEKGIKNMGRLMKELNNRFQVVNGSLVKELIT